MLTKELANELTSEYTCSRALFPFVNRSLNNSGKQAVITLLAEQVQAYTKTEDLVFFTVKELSDAD